jgi:hypothetical protein
MFRLFSRLSAGKHTTGSAATRRGLAGRPQRKFSQAHLAAPGELMEIDSTPLDVLVLLDDGVPGRVELTGMIDVATRTVPAAVIRPTAKSADASVLLARALTPEPMRPGWPASLAMAHSALPYDRLLGIDGRLRHAAARPVIVPDTIVIDHGSVFVSGNFGASCRHLGISIQPAHLATGSDKPRRVSSRRRPRPWPDMRCRRPKRLRRDWRPALLRRRLHWRDYLDPLAVFDALGWPAR